MRRLLSLLICLMLLAPTAALADKTVTIDGCQNCVKTAVGELEDLGFTPEVRE